MSVKVLGISTSPRINGNSDQLLRQALGGAEAAGAKVEHIHLSDFTIGPCRECGACYSTGRCVVQDDCEQIMSKMLDADRIILATPVFFMSVCAQAKAFIDRGQCLWARKHLLKEPLATGRPDRRGMVIAVGGSKSKRMFESIRLTIKSYFDALDVHYTASLFVSGVDRPGEIDKNTAAMKEAFRLGTEMAGTDKPVPEKPLDIELA